MKHVLLAVAVSFACGFAASASATTKRPSNVGPSAAESCQASGHACSTAEDCCSRMCRKDTKKCA